MYRGMDVDFCARLMSVLVIFSIIHIHKKQHAKLFVLIKHLKYDKSTKSRHVLIF